MRDRRLEARRVAAELEEPVREAADLARRLGLDPYPVNYWIVDHDEMNALVAYDGFQTRYPHWRWGMKYDRQRKSDRLGLGKAFELVNNDDPANAFLQESNSLADQKAVITHVEAHADFFANNEWFGLFAEGRYGRGGRDADIDGSSGEHGTPGREAGEPDGAPDLDGAPAPGADAERNAGRDDRGLDATAMLARHAELIEGYMSDPEIDREAVERFIDAVLCLEDTIDQHRPMVVAGERVTADGEADPRDRLEGIDLSEAVRREVFDDEWLDEQAEAERAAQFDEPSRDVLAYLREHGMQYDEEAGRAVEMEDWQRDVLEALRTEAYYFAGQKMTKVMNEGWAAYWESLMMGDERFAGDDEFLTYAEHQARVLGSPGLNPYKLGKELWEYVENTTNRREAADRLLRVEGVTWRNFHDAVDFDAVESVLAPHPAVAGAGPDRLDDLTAMVEDDDPRVDAEGVERARAGEFDAERYPWKLLTYEGLAERHFSLARHGNRAFLRRVSREELERLSRYMFDDERYADVREAAADVDRSAGWERMREVRESHNDVTFIDAFLTEEFVTDNDYFTYEYARSSGDYRVTSSDYEDVKKKLLLQFTNFGKPTVDVYDGNFENRNELLLGHRYNGVSLDVERAKRVLERTYELWGRPVNLMTIVKEYDEHDLEIARRRNREPTPEEVGKRIRYDGERFETHELAPDLEALIAASEVDYDTKPEEWLA
ncbi:MAG: SpoVR family protein [Haloferacaceae archaeon]